jgi:hypothetical protein
MWKCWEEEECIYRVLIGGNKIWNLLKKKNPAGLAGMGTGLIWKKIQRATLNSSSSEPRLIQVRLIKIRVELMKRFELKNLTQTRFTTIQTGSRANAYILTQFDIYKNDTWVSAKLIYQQTVI